MGLSAILLRERVGRPRNAFARRAMQMGSSPVSARRSPGAEIQAGPPEKSPRCSAEAKALSRSGLLTSPSAVLDNEIEAGVIASRERGVVAPDSAHNEAAVRLSRE